MANVCDFNIKIKGSSKENLIEFYEYITQTNDIWLGRGAEIYSPAFENIHEKIEEEDGRYSLVLAGMCKWSMNRAFIRDAIDMRKKPDEWDCGREELTFLTIFEACEKLQLEMEGFSEELANLKTEHISYVRGVQCLEKKDFSLDEDGNPQGGFDWLFSI